MIYAPHGPCFSPLDRNPILKAMLNWWQQQQRLSMQQFIMISLSLWHAVGAIEWKQTAQVSGFSFNQLITELSRQRIVSVGQLDDEKSKHGKVNRKFTMEKSFLLSDFKNWLNLFDEKLSTSISSFCWGSAKLLLYNNNRPLKTKRIWK